MKLSLQQKRMGEIYGLLTQDLSHIYGEGESGNNAVKKVFLRKTAAFLRRLGKDLGFTELKVSSRAKGLACHGKVTLFGEWNKDNGLFFSITQFLRSYNGFYYSEVKNVKESRVDDYQLLPFSVFKEMDYERLCETFLAFKKEEAFHHAA